MTADGRAYGPIAIAWSVCGLALIQVGMFWLVVTGEREVVPLITLIPLIGLILALGVILVAGWCVRSGGTHWGWLLLAAALGMQIWATVLDLLPRALLPRQAEPFNVVVSTITGIALIIGPARIWADQTITVGSTLQRLLEAGIISLVALIVLGHAPDVPRSAWPVELPTMIRLMSYGIVVSAIGVLLVTGRKLAGFLGGAMLGGVIAIGTPMLVGTDGRAGSVALELVPWSIVALAAAYRASPAPHPPASYRVFDRDDPWRGSSFARLTLVGGLAGTAFWSLAAGPLVIGLVGIAVVYEACLPMRHHELQRRRRAFVRRERVAVHEARERDQQLIQSLARLIHDLGPPIQSVSSIADLLMRIAAREVCESPQAISERLGRHADYLEHLIRQLNARLRRQDRSHLHRRAIDVAVIATIVVESLQPLARRRRIDLSVSLGTPATEVLGDAYALRRILDNLVNNALAATPPAGIVVVELATKGAHPGDLTISVRDAGPGLTTDEQQRVFLPRIQPSTGPGMGLGLAIVAELTEQLGGAYGVKSEPGAGSTFWVRLPREKE